MKRCELARSGHHQLGKGSEGPRADLGHTRNDSEDSGKHNQCLKVSINHFLPLTKHLDLSSRAVYLQSSRRRVQHTAVSGTNSVPARRAASDSASMRSDVRNALPMVSRKMGWPGRAFTRQCRRHRRV